MIKNKNVDPNANIQASKIALANGKTLVGTSAGVGSEVTAASVVTLANGKILVGDAGGNASAVTPSGDVTITNTGVTAVGAQKLDGANVKNAAAADVIGGIPVVHMFTTADTGAATTNTDIVLTHKTKILEVMVVKTSTAALNNGANTVQIINGTGSNAITDLISIRNAPDETIVRAATLSDANQTVTAGGTLRLARVLANGTDDNACDVYVFGVRSA